MPSMIAFVRLVLLLFVLSLLNGCGRPDETARESKQNIAALQARIAELEEEVKSLRAEKESIEADLIAENETIKQDLRKEFEQRLTKLQQGYETRVQDLDARIGNLHLQLGESLQEKAVLERRLGGERGRADAGGSGFMAERIVWIVLLLIALGAAAYFGVVYYRSQRPLGEGVL